MGLFDNHFPYSNFHELNLDWVLEELKRLDKKVDDLKDTISGEIKEYVDEKIQELVNGEIATLTNRVNQLEFEFNATVAQLGAQYTAFTNTVNAQIQLMRSEIAAAKAEFQAMIIGANAYTDTKIALAKEDIYEHLSTELQNVKVLNFFTGQLVTVQQMFDTLAQLHVTDGLSYTQITARNNTYTQMTAYARTYIDITLYANTIITQH